MELVPRSYYSNISEKHWHKLTFFVNGPLKKTIFETGQSVSPNNIRLTDKGRVIKQFQGRVGKLLGPP